MRSLDDCGGLEATLQLARADMRNESEESYSPELVTAIKNVNYFLSFFI